MSDFEERLTGTLTERASSAPDVVGLAEGARVRSRRRRTARVVAAAVGGVAVVAAVPIGIDAIMVDESSGGIASPPPVSRDLPADWRSESYRDVEFAVPLAWGYGALSQYCISSNSNPIVERPGGASTQVACPKAYGYGVLVTDGDGPDISDPSSFPAGAAVRAKTLQGVTVTAIAKSEEVAETIIELTNVYPGADYYGCEAQVAVPALGEMADTGGDEPRGPASLCRYQIGVDGPNLVDSEAVTDADDLDSLWLGLTSAEPGTGPDAAPDSCDPQGWPPAQALLIRSAGDDLAWVHYDGCVGHGLDVRGTTYELNPQVTYWALPRGGFGVHGSVPTPKEQRP